MDNETLTPTSINENYIVKCCANAFLYSIIKYNTIYSETVQYAFWAGGYHSFGYFYLNHDIPMTRIKLLT